MQVNSSHLLEGVKFQRSPNIGGMMTPTGAIMHYTAGATGSSAINTLCNPASKVSAHLVIDRDGTITQLVPFNRVAWHAGPSILDGINGCNNFCVGFEFVNPGWFHLPKGGVGYTDAAGKPISSAQIAEFCGSDGIIAPNARIGGGTFLWPAYTPKQIDAGLAAFAAVCAAYKISHIAGHEQIDTRKWKTDPGPNFPMGKFKAQLHGTTDRSDGGVHATTLVTTNKVNVRATPGPGGAILAVLEKGSEVVLKQATTTGWTTVEYVPGKTGFVATQYLTGV